MPELPEVEVTCQALKAVLEGFSITKIQLNRPDLRYPLPPDFENEICFYSIQSVQRRAKYLLIDFEHGRTLIWHLGMSGRVIVETPEIPFLKASPHDHVIFRTSNNHKITYRDPRRFGFLQLTPTSQLASVNPFNKLGPEPLNNAELNVLIFHDRMKKHTKPIKNALLDQKLIAGIGNIYASEALWQARISPLRPANSLTQVESARLLKELQDVLKRAIAAGGSTLRDYVRPNGEVGYFQYIFKVYDRENKLCGHCEVTNLSKIIQCGRATYYCKICQK